jgi:ornithine carbamoyltransferase
MRHFLEVDDLSLDELQDVLDRADAHPSEKPLAGKGAALYFEKPSLRTRHSAEMAIVQLGGHPVTVRRDEIGAGARETLSDIANVLAGYHAFLGARVYRHDDLEAFAAADALPIVNLLSEVAHPCQALADLLTIQEWFGEVAGKTIVFVGDGNNVARSLAIACAKVGGKFILARPNGYGFDADFAAKYRKHVGSALPEETTDAVKAVKHADVIYTDVWTSMGQEAEREARLKQFAPYQVNSALLAKAPKHVKVMHCLPAHRGEEITDEVIESPASVVFQQAGNRLHAQKAVLEWLLG